MCVGGACDQMVSPDAWCGSAGRRTIVEMAVAECACYERMGVHRGRIGVHIAVLAAAGKGGAGMMMGHGARYAGLMILRARPALHSRRDRCLGTEQSMRV